MALYYEWGFDVAQIASGFSVDVTDSSGAAGADRTFAVSFTTGTYCHTTLAGVTATSTYTAFAAALETALEAGSALGATPRGYAVTWSRSTGYTIALTSEFSGGPGTKLTLDFTTSDAKTNLRRVLGMTGDRTGALTYSSTVRPYYFLIPSIQGRSSVDEREPDGLSEDSISDDGSADQISCDTAEVHLDWVQMAEPDAPDVGFLFADAWSPPYERHATSAAPWSYMHAFRHARAGKQPFLVADGSQNLVCELRADGTSFKPQRSQGPDVEIWNIAFRTRLLGRL